LVALLHDVVEDSDITLAQLRQADFPDDVVTAIDCLTRREDESYDEFITRILPNRLACRVKLADIEDNMNLTRLTQLTPKDIERLERYMQARQRIMTVLSTSSPE
jgi:translation elongation factor EF-Ts